MNRPLPRRALLTGLLGVAALSACAAQPPGPRSAAPAPDTAQPAPTASAAPTPAAAPRAVPVLCYHQVRPYQSGDSAYTRGVLVIPPERFRAHLDAIVGAGYETISPAQHLAHLTSGAPLPAKPVLLTFDDGKDNQPRTAFAELTRRGLQGTLFVMTVVIGKKGWISADEIRAVAAAGHTIGSHTYDHQPLPKITGAAMWTEQLVDSRALLRKISGQPVDAFAYPYGSWAPASLPHVRDAGYTIAYQLQERPVSDAAPLLTQQRALAASTWSGDQVVARLDALAAAGGSATAKSGYGRS